MRLESKHERPALDVTAANDPRHKGMDFSQLDARAEAQRALADERCLEAARQALLPEPA